MIEKKNTTKHSSSNNLKVKKFSSVARKASGGKIETKRLRGTGPRNENK